MPREYVVVVFSGYVSLMSSSTTPRFVRRVSSRTPLVDTCQTDRGPFRSIRQLWLIDFAFINAPSDFFMSLTFLPVTSNYDELATLCEPSSPLPPSAAVIRTLPANKLTPNSVRSLFYRRANTGRRDLLSFALLPSPRYLYFLGRTEFQYIFESICLFFSTIHKCEFYLNRCHFKYSTVNNVGVMCLVTTNLSFSVQTLMVYDLYACAMNGSNRATMVRRTRFLELEKDLHDLVLLVDLF